MADEDINKDPNPEGDPAEFLLTNSKYHDCHLTVGDPETDDVERIGVSSPQLIAHSSVFRNMLADSDLADPSGANTHIKDVSPAVFKLMLRHIYGGKLPEITSEEAAGLAMCADKYNVRHLVGKATKRLKPGDDFFLASKVVTYIQCPDLELRVAKIIQQETKRIVEDPKFLEVDENCILFIVKQSILNLNELELWKKLVYWAENHMQKYPEKTLRDCLVKVLPYVRLLTLSLEEIAKHVLPVNILTPEEFVDLCLAITNKQSPQSTVLCNSKEKRVVNEYIFIPERNSLGKYRVLHETKESKMYSSMTITPTKNIELIKFVFKTDYTHTSNEKYVPVKVTSDIKFYVYKNGFKEKRSSGKFKGDLAPNQLVSFPVIDLNGRNIVLETGKSYVLAVSAKPALRTHKLCDGSGSNCTIDTYSDGHGMSVTYADPFHIREIVYRVQE